MLLSGKAGSGPSREKNNASSTAPGLRGFLQPLSSLPAVSAHPPPRTGGWDHNVIFHQSLVQTQALSGHQPLEKMRSLRQTATCGWWQTQAQNQRKLEVGGEGQAKLQVWLALRVATPAVLS
ncbi:hypothetical protein GHT09_006873 [Marmota monax]|uniref:Uncharacterized protein n=1 Tax=Marmota monax TaxID=9995 RepID=A0A834V382_MARMO|nr:hypothetical protein GHT09_006873 [Marmota monax]